MLAPSNIPLDALLDANRIASIAPDLEREQQELVKLLPGTVHTEALPVGDYKVLFQARHDIYGLSGKLDDLLEKAEKTHPERSTTEWQESVSALREAEESSRILKEFVVLCRQFQKCKELQEGGSYVVLAQELNRLKGMLNERSREERCGFERIGRLKVQRNVMQSELTEAVKRKWKSMVQIGEKEEERYERLGEVLGIRVGFATEDGKSFVDTMSDVIDCLKLLRIFEEFIGKLADALADMVIIPVLQGATVRVLENPAPVLMLTLPDPGKIPDAVVVADELYEVFSFLDAHLFIRDAKKNQPFVAAVRDRSDALLRKQETPQSMDMVARTVMRSLPRESSKFVEAKSTLCSKFQELENLLRKIGWIEKETTIWHLDETVLEQLYTKKCATDLLVLSRKMFLSDKDLSAPVKAAGIPGEPPLSAKNAFALLGFEDMSISHSMASVSKSSEELAEDRNGTSLSLLVPAIYNAYSLYLELVRRHLGDRLLQIPALNGEQFGQEFHQYRCRELNLRRAKQARNSEFQCLNWELSCNLARVFDWTILLLNILQTPGIQKLPAHVLCIQAFAQTVTALFFTDCIYASSSLYVISRIIQCGSHDEGDKKYSSCFADLMVKFRQAGYESLTTSITRHATEVISPISRGASDINSVLNRIAQAPLHNLTEKASLKQSVDILRKLSDSWRDVLPATVFQQSIGKVTSTLLDAVVGRILTVEDIGSTDSTMLCENFRWLQQQTTNFLKASETVEASVPVRFVASWARFEELIFVLGASMGEIADRWADGQGLLAAHFKPEDLKHLIRALFENNDKRARLLALIQVAG